MHNNFATIGYISYGINKLYINVPTDISVNTIYVYLHILHSTLHIAYLPSTSRITYLYDFLGMAVT
jgi:hypothetical protein